MYADTNVGIYSYSYYVLPIIISLAHTQYACFVYHNYLFPISILFYVLGVVLGWLADKPTQQQQKNTQFPFGVVAFKCYSRLQSNEGNNKLNSHTPHFEGSICLSVGLQTKYLLFIFYF